MQTPVFVESDALPEIETQILYHESRSYSLSAPKQTPTIHRSFIRTFACKPPTLPQSAPQQTPHLCHRNFPSGSSRPTPKTFPLQLPIRYPNASLSHPQILDYSREWGNGARLGPFRLVTTCRAGFPNGPPGVPHLLNGAHEREIWDRRGDRSCFQNVSVEQWQASNFCQ